MKNDITCGRENKIIISLVFLDKCSIFQLRTDNLTLKKVFFAFTILSSLKNDGIHWVILVNKII